MLQYYCENDGRFLPDEFIKGTCPKCGATDQHCHYCSLCGSTHNVMELKSPICITCEKVAILKEWKPDE